MEWNFVVINAFLFASIFLFLCNSLETNKHFSWVVLHGSHKPSNPTGSNRHKLLLIQFHNFKSNLVARTKDRLILALLFPKIEFILTYREPLRLLILFECKFLFLFLLWLLFFNVYFLLLLVLLLLLIFLFFIAHVFAYWHWYFYCWFGYCCGFLFLFYFCLHDVFSLLLLLLCFLVHLLHYLSHFLSVLCRFLTRWFWTFRRYY